MTMMCHATKARRQHINTHADNACVALRSNLCKVEILLMGTYANADVIRFSGTEISNDVRRKQICAAVHNILCAVTCG